MQVFTLIYVFQYAVSVLIKATQMTGKASLESHIFPFFRANNRLLHNSGWDLSLQGIHLSLSKVPFSVLQYSPYTLQYQVNCMYFPCRSNARDQFPLYLIRVFCPANCVNEPSYWAPVVGSNVYGDVSTCFSPRVSLQGWEMINKGEQPFVVKHLWVLKWACCSFGEGKPRELSVWV